MGNIGPDCANLMYFGKGTADEKVFCISSDELEEHEDKATATVSSCNIYSIGSNDNWGFEEEVQQKLPHCDTHTFDCTLQNNTPKRKPQSDKVNFYPYCIGSNDAQLPYLSYQSLVETTQINNPPKLLKMDVEGFEFDVLLSVLSTDPSMWPEQIIMEVHWSTRMVDISWMLRTRQAAEIALYFGVLFNRGGYIPVHRTFFPGCGPCMEVLLVRAVC
jgi:FkbM family methyltransferase|eukprot:scaffold2918_cov230-Alexandrium_tamarense.AAC.4